MAESHNVAETLAERGKRYGDFEGHASITQALKETMHACPNWYRKLNVSQRESLDMIAHKIGRILNGDPDYVDSWHDIAGYAKLVEDQLVAVPILNMETTIKGNEPTNTRAWASK